MNDPLAEPVVDPQHVKALLGEPAASNPDGTAAMPALPAMPRPQMSAVQGLQISQGLLSALAEEVDKIDAHFMGAPPKGRMLEPDEVEMLMRRRRTVSMIRRMHDDAQSILSVVEPAPSPF